MRLSGYEIGTCRWAKSCLVPRGGPQPSHRAKPMFLLSSFRLGWSRENFPLARRSGTATPGLLPRSFRMKIVHLESHRDGCAFTSYDASIHNQLQTPDPVQQGRPGQFEHDVPSVRKRVVAFKQYPLRAYVDSPSRSGLCDHFPVEEFVMNVEPEGIPAMQSVLFRGWSDTRNTEHSASYHPRVDISSGAWSVRYGRGGSHNNTQNHH